MSAVVATMVRAYLAAGDPDAVASPAPPTDRRDGPSWLPPVAGRAEWARSRAAAVQALMNRYPAELAALDENWPKDAAVREQLWALTVWRDLLDAGAYDDPRMELAFATSLADFAAFLHERPRLLARQRR